jgi:hypothetical protein
VNLRNSYFDALGPALAACGSKAERAARCHQDARKALAKYHRMPSHSCAGRKEAPL